MEQLKERLKIKIQILTEKMNGQAEVKAYTEAARLQAEIGSLEEVLIMIRQIESEK